MFSQTKNLLLIMSFIIGTSYAHAETAESKAIPVQEELVEIEGPGGQKFLVNKRNLIPIESKEDTKESKEIEQIIKQKLEQSQETENKSNIQINVDAKKYFNNVNNTTTNKTESNNLEIKDNTESTINAATSTSDKTDIKSEDSSIDSNNSFDAKAGIKASAQQGDVTLEQDISTKIDSKEIIIQTEINNTEINPPAATPEDPTDDDNQSDTEDDATNDEDSDDEADPTPQPVIPVAKRFSAKGILGYGMYTSISDINSNYSLGFGVGYDINKNLTIELQYIFTEYQDTYNYVYYGYGSSYAGDFNQNDFSLLLNYKVLPFSAVNLMARGGLNFSHKYHRDYYGYSENSSSLMFVLGAGADIRIMDNIYFTTNIDYNLNISSQQSAYSSSGLLDLVSGGSFVNYNLGIKIKL